jgi:hypothetical protein
MIASFFRHLERQGAEWLLISGQATILYGAATFSEDVDVWVNPTQENMGRFQRALSASRARYYRLTPPFTADFASRHHGFHFVLPDPDSGSDVYLDVMGCPPRVGSFTDAKQRARDFDTRWGCLHTVGVTDLVEIKKTQRARDYPIISRLALRYLEDRGAECTDLDLRWALDNIFSRAEFEHFVLGYSGADRIASGSDVACRAAEQIHTRGQLDPLLEDELEAWFDDRIAILRRNDRRFWRPVIDELRALRANDGLVPQDTLV